MANFAGTCTSDNKGLLLLLLLLWKPFPTLNTKYTKVIAHNNLSFFHRFVRYKLAITFVMFYSVAETASILI